MPHPRRRLRFALYAIIAIAVLIILASLDARTSDQRFRERTVAGLNAKKAAAAEQPGHERDKAPLVGPEAKTTALTKEWSSTATAAAPTVTDKTTRRPPEVVEADKNKPGVRKAGERWGEEEEKKPEKTPEEQEVEAELNAILKRSPIIIFSKTYCPFSKKAKAVFAEYRITPAPYIVELDEHSLGPKLQAQLERSTGRRTVPNVLISGMSIGGGDDVAKLHDEGELAGKIQSLGGKRITEVTRIKNKDWN